MAVMTKPQMQLLVLGSTNPHLNSRGIDILSGYLPAIAMAALGDDEVALHAAIAPYADEMEKEMEGVTFPSELARNAASEYIKWLRDTPIH